MRKKLIIILSGGLGNQMFQFAFGYSLSKQNNLNLIFDTQNGFLRDKAYKRRFELNYVKLNKASLKYLLSYWVYKFENKYFKNNHFISSTFFGDYLIEQHQSYLSNINQYQFSKNTFAIGYWQTSNYFNQYSNDIAKILMPAPPKQNHFLELSEQLRKTNSCAIGIRLYEESTNPGAHAFEGKTKSISDINNVIQRMINKVPDVQFYVFCTHYSSQFDDLVLPKNTKFITHDNFSGTLERLWLLTNCRNHIFTISTYYWWGAWLSKFTSSYRNVSQVIIASDHFINQDCILSNWEKF